jgi:alpha-beta hydrolase superfamily lysophospholipase
MSNEPRITYDELTLPTTAGLTLFGRAWSPEGPPRAEIALVHGYAEHSGRYDYAARFLAARGYAVTAIDLRGHGKSEGERVLVRSFNEYLDDVESLLAHVRGSGEGRPLFLLGHSMGGAIAALAVVSRRPRINGLLLSGPAVNAPRGFARLLNPLIQFLGRRFPKLGVRTLPAGAVSRDPAVVADYDADPLNYRGKVPAGLAAAMFRASDTIDRRAPRIDMPLLVLHGSDDQLVPADASRGLYDRATSHDKTLKIYDGLYHEIMNEPERDSVLADIADWLDAHAFVNIPVAANAPTRIPSALAHQPRATTNHPPATTDQLPEPD